MEGLAAWRQLLRAFAPSLHAQTYSESNADGEVIYYSWDDGDDGTWEGQQFFEAYRDGYWELTDLQEDINEDPRVLWAWLSGSRDDRELRHPYEWESNAFLSGPMDREGGSPACSVGGSDAPDSLIKKVDGAAAQL